MCNPFNPGFEKLPPIYIDFCRKENNRACGHL